MKSKLLFVMAVLFAIVSMAEAKQISFSKEGVSFVIADDVAYVKKSEYDNNVLNPQGIANGYLNYSFAQGGIVVFRRGNDIVSVHSVVDDVELKRANNAENVYGRDSDRDILNFYDQIFKVMFPKKSYDRYCVINYGKKYINALLCTYASVEVVIAGSNNSFYMCMAQTIKNGVGYTVRGFSQISEQNRLNNFVESIISSMRFD